MAGYARRFRRAVIFCGHNLNDYLPRHDCIELNERPTDQKARHGAGYRDKRRNDRRRIVSVFNRNAILAARAVRNPLRAGRGRGGRIVE